MLFFYSIFILLPLLKMKIEQFGIHRLPKKTVLFECPNGNFYINELGVVTVTKFREQDQTKLMELQNNLLSIESELEYVDNILTRDELLVTKHQLENDIKRELQVEIDLPYQVTLTEKQVYVWLDKAKQAKKDSIWSILYTTGCPLDFGLWTEIIYNPEKFSWEWCYNKKAE